MTLQHNPILPLIVRWTRPMPHGFFAADPLQSYVAGLPREKLVQIGDLFSNRTRLMRSDFYRRYVAPQGCRHGAVLFFWKSQGLVCVIAILRAAQQGDLSLAEMKVLRQLYPQFLIVLDRIRSLERERLARMAFEEFLGRLPLPTMLLRWNLKLIYRNRAARDFCAVWEKGCEQARLIKPRSAIPSEILDRCRALKQQWRHAQRRNAPPTRFKEERVHHPRSPHLRATLHLKQLGSVGVAQPHFLIACEDLRRHAAPRAGLAISRLPHLAQLTSREQEVARLVCDGRSNQEIADHAGLSLATIKKHVHAIFRKLEVPSRSRLMTLMR